MSEITKIRSESTGFIAEERLWTTVDGKIVRDGDYRAAQLLAPKGGTIPERVALKLGLAKGIKIESLEKSAPKPKTTAPEDIESRSTRPESVKATR